MRDEGFIERRISLAEPRNAVSRPGNANSGMLQNAGKLPGGCRDFAVFLRQNPGVAPGLPGVEIARPPARRPGSYSVAVSG